MNQYEVIFEDDDILVANKLAPIPVQSDKSGDESLQEMLSLRLRGTAAPDAGVPVLEATHRIDRRTSGIVIFAKTRTAIARLDADFRERAVKKLYVACVEREPDPPVGRLEHEIRFDSRANISRAVPPSAGAGSPQEKDAQAQGQPRAQTRAILEYSLACRSERYFFLDVVPETGKHHQIRAQLAAAGCPIRGDLKYGARRSCRSGRIMLHARRVEFLHPRTDEALSFTAPFPSDEPLWAAYLPAASEQA